MISKLQCASKPGDLVINAGSDPGDVRQGFGFCISDSSQVMPDRDLLSSFYNEKPAQMGMQVAHSKAGSWTHVV